jgi:hypothetical protein
MEAVVCFASRTLLDLVYSINEWEWVGNCISDNFMGKIAEEMNL